MDETYDGRKSNEQRAESNKQRAKTTEQGTKPNKQRAASKKFSLCSGKEVNVYILLEILWRNKKYYQCCGD